MFLFLQVGISDLARSFFVSVVSVGLSSVAIFWFDPYGKLVIGSVSGYALMSHDYVLSTVGQKILLT